MKNFIHKHFISLLGLLAGAIFLYKEWFIYSGILTFGDWYVVEPDWLREAFSLPYIWSSSVNLGDSVLVMSFYPVTLAMGVLGRMGFGFGTVERIAFMWPIILASVAGTYIFSYHVLKSRIGAVVATLVYFLNTYFMLGRTGHLTLMVAYSLFPIILYFYHKLSQKRSLTSILILSLLLSVVSFYEIRAFYILAFVILFFVMFFLDLKSKNLREIVIDLGYMGTPLFVAGAVNLYWILALSQIQAVETGEFFHRILFGNAFMSLERATTLFHPFWSGAGLTTFVIQTTPIYFWLIPIMAFIGLYVGRHDRRILFYGLLALVGILLTKQVDTPFPLLYEWLYAHFPGFIAFREASKFYSLIALSYSILIGSSIKWAWDDYQHYSSNRQLHMVLAVLITLMTSCVFLFNARPILNGDLKDLLTNREQPTDYKIFSDRLTQGDSEDFSRTLWVPIWSRWSYYTETHPRMNMLNMLSAQWGNVWKDYGSEEELNYINILQQPFSDKLLELSSIQYVVIPTRDLQNDDDFFVNYGGRGQYVRNMRSIPFLEEIDGKTEELLVFENKGYRPHIYTSDQVDTFYFDPPIHKPVFKRQDRTRYTINLEHVSKPIYLYFSEAYSPDWHISLGKASILDMLSGGGSVFPDSIQTKTDAQLQVFRIDPAYIRDTFSSSLYTVHEDGSISFDIDLYYRPQVFIRLGLVVTVLGLITLAWLLTHFHRRYHAKPTQIS